MLIQDSVWEKIREQFSEEEKKELRQAVTNECICPPGMFIDLDKLDSDLKTKIVGATRTGFRGDVS